jgi:hypothetical protein
VSCSDDEETPTVPNVVDLKADSLWCVEIGGWAVGPSGGEFVYQDDPTYETLIVRIEAQPGGLEYMACFSPETASPAEAIRFPDGYSGYFIGACFDLDPASSETILQNLELRMSLPIPSTLSERDSTDVLCAFYYDEDRSTWSITLPTAVDESTMTVETPYQRIWNWGVVDFSEADCDLSLKPLLKGLFGDETGSALESAIHEMLYTVFDPEVELTCERISFVRNTLLTEIHSESEAYLDSVYTRLYAGCGPCPLTSKEFVNNLARYLVMEMGVYFFEYVYSGIHGDEWLHMWDSMMIPVYLQAISYYMLNCNYECIFLLADNDFWINLFWFHVAQVCMDLIDAGIDEGYINCP